VSDPTTRYYPDRPFSCALAVCRRGERVLLARRAMGPGIEAEPVRIIGGSNVIGHDDAGRVRAHFTLVAVLLDWSSGEGAPIEDASEVRWVTLAEAGDLDTFADAIPLMRLALGALA